MVDMVDKYNQYKPISSIGKGSYGIVHKRRNLLTGDTVAMKKIFLTDRNEGVPSSVIREVSLLKELEHENIVRLVDVLNDQDCISLVFEFLDIDLQQFMLTKPIDARNPRIIKKFLHQILRGVEHCHSHKILHRDLKPQNLLIDCYNERVKLADFGMARAVDVPLEAYTSGVSTLRYMAPEILLGNTQYSSAVDVWSVACIFAEMVNGQQLFRGHGLIDQLLTVFSIMGIPDEETLPGLTSFYDLGYEPERNPPKDLAKEFPGLEQAGVDLLYVNQDFNNKMLSLAPAERITAHEALKHEYFMDVQNVQ